MVTYAFSYEGLGIEEGKQQLLFKVKQEAEWVKELFEELGLKCGDIYSIKGSIPFFKEEGVKIFEEYLENELMVLESIAKIINYGGTFDKYINELGNRIFCLIGESSSHYDPEIRTHYILYIISALKIISKRANVVTKEILGKILPKQIFFAYKS